MTNTPEQGTGSEHETVMSFKELLDSENATPVATHENEITPNENTSEDAADEGAEHVDGHSESADEVDTEDAEASANPEAVELPSDDFIVGRDDDGNPITAKEYREGYLRRASYTKAMQEIAPLRKAWTVDQQASAQRLHAIEQHIEQQLQIVDAIYNPQKPFNFEEEWKKDPYEAQLKEFEWNREHSERINKINELRAAKQQIAEKKQAIEAEQLLHRKISARETLAEKMPQIFGDQFADANLDYAAKGARDFGITEAELNAIDDHRFIEVLYYAAKGKEAEQKVAKAVQKVEATPALIMPGTASSKSNTTGFEAKYRDVRNGKASTSDLFRELLKQ